MYREIRNFNCSPVKLFSQQWPEFLGWIQGK